MSVRRALVTAGGYGRRMRPLTRAYQKEMLPLGRKPALHHIVDELHGAGISDVIIATRPDCHSIHRYFENIEGVRIQTHAVIGGTGHAILVAREQLEEEPFLLVFGDSPLRGTPPHKLIGAMMDAFASLRPALLLGIYRTPLSETSLHGIVAPAHQVVSGPVRILAIQEKPAPAEALSTWSSACRYVVDPQIFDVLETLPPAENGEIQITDAISRLIQSGAPVYGLPLAAGQKRYDIGNFRGYFQAFAEYAADV